MKLLLSLIVAAILIEGLVAPPVDKKKKKDKEHDEDNEIEDIDKTLQELGLEYGRYLQEIVQTLEEDKEFANKLQNMTEDHIKSGAVAYELEMVNHNVRTKLDELKRKEIDRLRELKRKEMERNELGLYRDEEGYLVEPPSDGRRWRSIPKRRVGDGDGAWLGLDRDNVKFPKHLDVRNPHTFEVDDLKKLIQTATRDLEKIDAQRREEFKKYEMEKEHRYRDSLKNMTEEERKEAEAKHQETIQKHKDHPKVHHPGSKQQLEQVWEQADHLPKEEFDPKTFFAMHDVNGDGYLDEQEVEAILNLEVRKIYDPNDPNDDKVEMMEEYSRMREHIYKETDKDKDGLISKKEFMDMTQRSDFEQDDGWKGIDEQNIYSEDDYRKYEMMREAQMRQYMGEMGQQQYYGGQHGSPPIYQDHPGYGGSQQGYHPGQQQQGHQQHYGLQQPTHDQKQGMHPGQQMGGQYPQHGQQPMGVPPQHAQQMGGQYQQHGGPQYQQQQQHGQPMGGGQYHPQTGQPMGGQYPQHGQQQMDGQFQQHGGQQPMGGQYPPQHGGQPMGGQYPQHGGQQPMAGQHPQAGQPMGGVHPPQGHQPVQPSGHPPMGGVPPQQQPPQHQMPSTGNEAPKVPDTPQGHETAGETKH